MTATAALQLSRELDALLGESVSRALPQRLILVSAALVAAFVVLLWRATSVASVHASLSLPLVSAQPCVLVLALMPILGLIVLVAVRTPARGPHLG